MKVLVIGAHGKVGRRLVKKLSNKNHHVRAMVRKEAQKTELQALGAEVVVANLERDIAHAYDNKMDAVIFAAGSGSDTGEDKTMAVDLQGARQSIDEALKHHVPRYILISALGVEDVNGAAPDMQPFYMAKSQTEEYLAQTELQYTIFRPARLTDEAGNGNVEAAQDLNGRGSGTTSRDDLATAIAEALDKRNTHRKVIEIVDGNVPVHDAIAAI